MISDRLLVVLAKILCATNIIAPLNKLPPELLRTIFLYLRPSAHYDWEADPTPPYADLFAVSCVCHHWREVAASATELWTNAIIRAPDSVPWEVEIPIARLCIRRSGVQPLDFFYATTYAFNPFSAEELIPDRHRLRSVVYRHVDEDSGDELVRFLLPALHLERQEIGGSGSFPFPTLFSDAAPCLRELVTSRCTPWPRNQFGSLTSLSLLHQMDIDSNIDFLNVLRRSPHLEELLLEREFGSSVESRHPQEPKTRAIPLHSLKRLHICSVLAGATDVS